MSFTLDAGLFLWMHRWLHQFPWLPGLNVLTHLGDPRSVLLLAAAGFLETAITRVKKAGKGFRWREAAPAVLPWLGIPLAALVTSVLKELVSRPRPAEVFGLFELEASQMGRSFPSGHAAAAFALAGVLSWRWPRGCWAWWSLAFLIALSRVALGMHWPSDVVAGALIGWMCVEFTGLKSRR